MNPVSLSVINKVTLLENFCNQLIFMAGEMSMFWGGKRKVTYSRTLGSFGSRNFGFLICLNII